MSPRPFRFFLVALAVWVQAAVAVPPQSVGITVTAPAANDRWEAETTHSIRWKGAVDPASRVRIALLDATRSVVIADIASRTPNTGVFDWTIPASVSSGQYRVGVMRLPARTPSGQRAPQSPRRSQLVYGVSQRFLISAQPAPLACAAGSDSDSTCNACTTAAACESCGARFVFSNGVCRRCVGEGLRVEAAFPPNVSGSERACVSQTWTASSAAGGMGGPGSCYAGPPWYFPAGWVTQANATAAMGYPTDGSAEGFNQITARALELYEWAGTGWTASCTCRRTHVFPGGSWGLRKVSCTYPPDAWSCAAGGSTQCDWDR